LRKFLRECPLKAQAIDVYIVSAEFGLISSVQPIAYYDRRLTPQRANQFRLQVFGELKRILWGEKCYQQLFIGMGRDYLSVLDGYQAWGPPEMKIIVSTGALGQQQAALRDWLHEEPAQASCYPRRSVAYLRGVRVQSTPEQILEIARQVLSEGHGNPYHYRSWYVQVDDQRVAPKWLVSQITGLPVSAFVTDEALRVLAQLGVEVIRA
jgi:hypothetical protein